MSKRRHVAMHCSSYCPAGTLVIIFEISVPVAIASERSLPTLHGLIRVECVGMGLCRKQTC